MTQEKCDKDVNACLPALRCVPNWFVTNKMLEKLDDTIFCNDDIIFANEDSDNVTCFSDGMGLIHYILTMLTLIQPCPQCNF